LRHGGELEIFPPTELAVRRTIHSPRGSAASAEVQLAGGQFLLTESAIGGA